MTESRPTTAQPPGSNGAPQTFPEFEETRKIGARPWSHDGDLSCACSGCRPARRVERSITWAILGRFLNYLAGRVEGEADAGASVIGTMNTAALLLSGGASVRFGGSPKALVSAGERTAVRRMAEMSFDRGFDPVAVVVGPHHSPIAQELRGLPVEFVDSEHWYEGRTASVQSGLRALPPGADVLLWPVDHPFVSARTLDMLVAARDTDDLGLWFVPTYQGQGGHPVLWKDHVRAEVLELRPDAPIRALIPELGPQVRRVAVDDPGILASIDTPEEYRNAFDAWLARRED